ncbi:hypothetical protein LEMLEM_LOCUS21834 [Lemmus lemmus]
MVVLAMVFHHSNNSHNYDRYYYQGNLSKKSFTMGPLVIEAVKTLKQIIPDSPLRTRKN